MPNNWILIFESVYQVMKAQKLIQTQNIKTRTIPVPRSLSSDCGIALEVDCVSEDSLRNILRKATMNPISVSLIKEKHQSVDRH